MQRYKCKECGTTFGATNNTPFYRTQKDLAKWNQYIELMFESQLSVVKIAEKIGIHYKTAFHWRHKILNALNEIDNPRLTGIVEADETYFRLSYKEQVCVLTAIDRSNQKNMLLQSTCLARPTTKHVEDVLGPHIASGSVLVTDRHNAYGGFARKAGLTHEVLSRSTDRRGSYHVQNVNSMHMGLKRFMRPFNGVATKYLDNYMTYYKWSGQDVAVILAQQTASITCNELHAIKMSLK